MIIQVYINYDFVSLNKFHSSLIYHGFLKKSHFLIFTNYISELFKSIFYAWFGN